MGLDEQLAKRKLLVEILAMCIYTDFAAVLADIGKHEDFPLLHGAAIFPNSNMSNHLLFDTMKLAI